MSCVNCQRLQIKLLAALKKNEELQQYEPRILLSSQPDDMKITVARDLMANCIDAFDALNGDANYSETEFLSRTGTAYRVLVQRTDKPTPHQLRIIAEKKLVEATNEIKRLTALNSSGETHHPDGNCPTYYDGCHCNVETLEDALNRANIAEERVKQLEEQLRLEKAEWSRT